MANSRSAEKRIRINERNRAYNRSMLSLSKTMVKKFLAACEAADLEEARARYNEAASVLDRAANKGVIHPNKAARKKARMARRLAQLAKAQ